MQALGDAMLYRWLCDYLESSYPERSREVGHGAVWELVRASVERARAREIEEDQEIRKYVHAAFLLGPGFEEDAKLSWARQILDDPRFEQPGERVQALEEAAVRHVQTAERSRKG